MGNFTGSLSQVMIKVPQQPDVIFDTLTIVPGNGITMTTNNETDTLTIEGVGGGSGTVLQTVYAENTAVATSNTPIPFDDSIPQNNEGHEIVTVNITPLDAASVLIIDFTINVGINNAADTATVAIFMDDVADSIGAVGQSLFAQGVAAISGTVKIATGSIVPTVIKIRAGVSTAQTLTVNGFNGARLYGGKAISCVTVQEILNP